MSDLPKRVSIDEEGPREGFQSEKKAIPVADKVRLIEALADAGLKRIACVSYVNPKRVPTMADAEEVAASETVFICGSTGLASSRSAPQRGQTFINATIVMPHPRHRIVSFAIVIFPFLKLFQTSLPAALVTRSF